MKLQKKLILGLVLLCAFTVIPRKTFAAGTSSDPSLKFGEARYAGTGCPEGSASVAISPDQSAFSVIFDQYNVEAGKSTGRMMNNKFCELTIPVEIPKGWALHDLQADYRMFSSLPSRGYALFSGLTRITGPRTYSTWFMDHRLFVGPKQDDLMFKQKFSLRSFQQCGGTAELKMWTRLHVVTNHRKEDSMVQVDSLDGRAAASYQLRLIRCQ